MFKQWTTTNLSLTLCTTAKRIYRSLSCTHYYSTHFSGMYADSNVNVISSLFTVPSLFNRCFWRNLIIHYFGTLYKFHTDLSFGHASAEYNSLYGCQNSHDQFEDLFVHTFYIYKCIIYTMFVYLLFLPSSLPAVLYPTEIGLCHRPPRISVLCNRVPV